MLYRALLLALALTSASAYQAPVAARGGVARASRVSMDNSWRRSYNGQGGGAVATPSAPSTVQGLLSVQQACKFMADPSLDKVDIEEKKAFLASKGISDFVIAQSSCTAPEDNVQG